MYDEETRQDYIFETSIKPIINQVLNGINCTIFAYGKTGTGKTYTMEGDLKSEEYQGVISRVISMIFNELRCSGCEYSVLVSYLEIYNEVKRNLTLENNKFNW